MSSLAFAKAAHRNHAGCGTNAATAQLREATTNAPFVTPTNESWLSAAALGSIIGACVAISIAVLLALVIWFRQQKVNESKKHHVWTKDGKAVSAIGGPHYDSHQITLKAPPMAKVLMVDHGILSQSPKADDLEDLEI